MRDAIGDADTVVNLIGKHYETKHLCFTRKEDGAINRVNSSFKNVRDCACTYKCSNYKSCFLCPYSAGSTPLQPSPASSTTGPLITVKWCDAYRVNAHESLHRLAVAEPLISYRRALLGSSQNLPNSPAARVSISHAHVLFCCPSLACHHPF